MSSSRDVLHFTQERYAIRAKLAYRIYVILIANKELIKKLQVTER
jgi:hypothetical protein